LGIPRRDGPGRRLPEPAQESLGRRRTRGGRGPEDRAPIRDRGQPSQHLLTGPAALDVPLQLLARTVVEAPGQEELEAGAIRTATPPHGSSDGSGPHRTRRARYGSRSNLWISSWSRCLILLLAR